MAFNIEFHNFLGTRGHHPHLLLVHLGEVGDIADLGERLHPLELVRHVQVGPSFTKIGEGGASVLKLVELIDKNGTDHCSCSSLPSLTMKSHNPLSSILASSEPSSHILDQFDHLVQPRHIVIVDLESPDVPVELAVVVLHLTAQVVDHVVNVARGAVLVLKELCYMVNLISVHSLASFAGEAHSNNVCGDISQIKVIAIHLKAPLVLRDALPHPFDQVAVFKVQSEYSHKPKDPDHPQSDNQCSPSCAHLVPVPVHHLASKGNNFGLLWLFTPGALPVPFLSVPNILSFLCVKSPFTIAAHWHSIFFSNSLDHAGCCDGCSKGKYG